MPDPASNGLLCTTTSNTAGACVNSTCDPALMVCSFNTNTMTWVVMFPDMHTEGVYSCSCTGNTFKYSDATNHSIACAQCLTGNGGLTYCLTN
jgi:hypothetical protein